MVQAVIERIFCLLTLLITTSFYTREKRTVRMLRKRARALRGVLVIETGSCVPDIQIVPNTEKKRRILISHPYF